MRRRIVSTILATTILSGCASAYRPADIFTEEPTTTLDPDTCAGLCGKNPFTWIQRLMFENPVYQINPYLYNPTCKDLNSCVNNSYYSQAANSGDSKCEIIKEGEKIKSVKLGKQEQARNELIGVSLRLADSAVSNHLASTKATENNMNLLLGAATAGLTGGATVAGSELAAKALSAAATGTNATRSMFNESVYRNALGETLVGAIESDRETRRATITDRLIECVSTYPVEIALSDIQKYLDAGSFYHGLALIREAAEQANSVRRGKIVLEDEQLKLLYQIEVEKLKKEIQEIVVTH